MSEQIDKKPFSLSAMSGWFISLSMYGALVLMVNFVARFPDINDFIGLSRICLFMEDNLIHCANNNWGFANPLLNYLLTTITGNLLLSQRIIAAFFTLSALVLCERIISSTLCIKDRTNKAFVLGFMAISPWAIESMLSVHLDIASITFVLCGILMASCQKKSWLILSGLFVSMSYWFRFHFLIYTLLYPIFVYGMNIRRDGLKKGLLSLVGLSAGILLPHVLSYLAYGAWSFTNQKMIFANAAGILDWSNGFARQLELMTYSDIIGSISWAQYCKIFLKDLLEPMRIFPFLFVCSSFFLITIYKVFWVDNQKKKVLWGAWVDTSEFKILVMILYIITSTLPFIFIRGLTLRLESALFITGIPVFAFIIDSQKTRRFFILLILFLFINWSFFSAHRIADKLYKQNLLARITDDIERAIPAETRKKHYNKILAGLEVYNRQNPYLSFSPEIMGGWLAHFPPLIQKFGQVEFMTLHLNRNYEKFKYIILAKHPQFVFWQYDQELLSKGVVLKETDDLIILEIMTSR
jgi:hypothetical protein